MDRTVPSVEDEFLLRDSVISVGKRRKFGSVVLRNCRRPLHSLAPTVVIPALIWCLGGDKLLPGSKLSLFLVFCLFCCICVCYTDGTPVIKSFILFSYIALFSFVAGRMVSHVASMLILYLDFLLAAFFFGITLAQRSNGTGRAAVANAVSLDHAIRCIWFTSFVLLLGSKMIPKSDLVVGPMLCLCLIIYSTFVGFRLGSTIIITLRMLRVVASNAFIAYRRRLLAYFDPSYGIMMEEIGRCTEEIDRRQVEKQERIMQQQLTKLGDRSGYPFVTTGVDMFEQLTGPPSSAAPALRVQHGTCDRRSLLVLSLVLAVTVLALLWCSGGEPALATRTFSLFIVSHLFCCTLYYSTEATPLANIFLFLSYSWLVAFFAGALLTDALGMVIFHMDSLLAAALFGVTLAQHRQRNGTETAMHVAFANSPVHMVKDRQGVYVIMGFIALCYIPLFVWLLLVDSPAIFVAISFFAAICFIQIIHISCVVSWLNGAVCTGDIEVRVLIYFAYVAFVFSICCLIFGELVGVTVFWHCLLASTAYLGYYSQVHASYVELLSRAPATAGYSVTADVGDDSAATVPISGCDIV